MEPEAFQVGGDPFGAREAMFVIRRIGADTREREELLPLINEPILVRCEVVRERFHLAF
jgi:hypothetical protein